MLQPLHTLHLYGAAGIVCLGWALARTLGFPCARYAPLWLAGALLVYNCDRLKCDPADVFNLPLRVRRHAKLRHAGLVVVAASALVLLAWPLFFRDRTLLALTLGAAVVSLGYSFPLLGFRFKDVPLVKTLFAPTVVTLAFFLPSWFSGMIDSNALPLIGWIWIYLVFNMTLCDLRDLDGDRRLLVRSLPLLVGVRNTKLILALMIVTLGALAFVIHFYKLSLVSAVYLTALLAALRQPRSETFYEWFAEGMLFLPPLVLAVAGGF